ncbi:hypothetical protein HAHI6034_07820 [Hathewaya histolytica]|uniref:ABC transporter ATP-binding protein n=1 Tax=Hathewaya histolytica TaxID=1498 RepID=A0A4U9QTL9_HATHI|nr:hypothetical protein [Hathewaya histolytica]VTQ81966.1 ABC transporter ATP-binding protein [Hathewaya histolytica]
MEFRKLLLTLAKEKQIGILISSHILSDLDKMCSRMLFLKNGEIIESQLNKDSLNTQNIVLTVSNPSTIILNIKEIKLIDDVIIVDDDKVSITLNKNNTFQFIEEMSKKNIQYKGIEISNDSTENLYKMVYGRK